MIKFCIITCTYNAERLIQRTLDSVASQTWSRVHHLIIDGASSDDTVRIVNDTAQAPTIRGEATTIRPAGYDNGKKVTIVSEPDKGLYDAMNKGLRLADGAYVLFLNAGDTFASSETLQQIAEATIREQSSLRYADATIRPAAYDNQLPGVIYGDTDIVDAANHYVGKREHDPPETLTWRSFQNGMLVCHQAFYVRTDIAKEVTYDMQYRFSADVDWCIRVMKVCEERGLTLLNMHRVLCHFLAGGMTIKNHRESLQERFHIMVKHYGLWTTIKKHIGFVINKNKDKEKN